MGLTLTLQRHLVNMILYKVHTINCKYYIWYTLF